MNDKTKKIIAIIWLSVILGGSFIIAFIASQEFRHASMGVVALAIFLTITIWSIEQIKK